MLVLVAYFNDETWKERMSYLDRKNKLNLKLLGKETYPITRQFSGIRFISYHISKTLQCGRGI